MRDCSWDTSVDFILWPWNCNYCALEIMCLKSIMPIENFLLPFLYCFKFKFKLTYSHPAQNLTHRLGSNQSSGIATGGQVHQVLPKTVYVQKELHQNQQQLPDFEFIAPLVRIFLVFLMAPAIAGDSVLSSPISCSPKQIHVPACRDIRDDTLQLKSKLSLSFGFTSRESKPLR